MKFYLLLMAFSLFFCSTKEQKSDKNTIEKAQKSNENEILKIKYFYVEPEIPINIDKDELEIVEVTKSRFLIYEQIYNKGVLKDSIIVDIPFRADTLFSSIPQTYLNNAKAYPFLNFKFFRDYPYECFYIFRQRDTIEWHIADELLPEDFVFYKNFKEFRLEQLSKRTK
ncbi:hypothetical protein JMN12_00095 [Capnocytophaga genosp. AHN8471]|uniref:hypothetical protein n=1 Tax=Capnocytophaga genosp. AHN8471 TaxID=327574 RepID=UPI00193266B7|nr:hypothetical protein [Capnocytophaga genosp. AHN8471]MBM0654975.1 hypothetical protein [Capnocytophaga genosp. AHN8471]MBM0658677.1 hypothetical protein [Capnocytophaga genosp. AHN8471]